MKYAAIADWATDKQYPVSFMCAQLSVCRQGYYRWLRQGASQRERTDADTPARVLRLGDQRVAGVLSGHDDPVPIT